MNIYLAGKISAKGSLKLIRKELDQLGHHVTSRWLDYGNESMSEREQASYALRDLEDIKQATCIIFYNGDEAAVGGGRECEWGFALSRMSMPLRVIVGLKRNVFHQLATHHFYEWEECLAWLAKLQ